MSRDLSGWHRSGWANASVVCAVGLSVAFCLALPVKAESSPGFSVTPLFPLTQGAAPYADPSPASLEAGRFETGTALIWANSLRYDQGDQWPGYSALIDGESLVSRTTMDFGIGCGLTGEAWVEGASLFGGVLDNWMSAFHHALGFANQWRDQVPPNQLAIRVVTPRGAMEEVATPRAGLESLGIGLSWSPSFARGLHVSGKIKLPGLAPDPWILGRAPSLGISAAYAGRFWIFDAALAAGLAWQFFPAGFDAILERNLLPQVSARLFLDILPDFSFGVEACASLSPFDTAEWYLGGIMGNTWIGINARITDTVSIEAAMIEELASWASIEVGFQAGLTWRAALRHEKNTTNMGWLN